MTVKKVKRDPTIPTIIRNLRWRQKRQTLCSVGRERLKWWLKNGRRFPTAKAAILTWDVAHVVAWFRDRSRAYRLPASVREANVCLPRTPEVTITYSNVPTETPEMTMLVELLRKEVARYKAPVSDWRKDLAALPAIYFNL